jgi:predicted phage terminase large subunit-like protein
VTHALSSLTREQALAVYAGALLDNDTEALRQLCRDDLFFLLVIGCKRGDMNRDWLYARCREVEACPDGCLDLWAREHYKSTIITFGKTIQDLLVDPNRTFGIFSHTRPIAKAFLKQIKEELEKNEFLKTCFPDVLWAEPGKQAPTWSLDGGITIKRDGNPKECSVEAWGLVDGQPTSKHFSHLVYDDVVTLESVTTPDQMKKTTDAWAVSLNLGAEGGARRMIGTRYHFNDTYRTVMERGAVRVRQYPATDNGKIDGYPVLMSPESLADKRRMMGPYVFGCQMLQDPKADSVQGFKMDWVRYYERGLPAPLNKYILVDPAKKKKKDNDYTVIWVLGLAADQNVYVVDMIRDRLSLTQKADKIFELVKRHRASGFQRVGYEEYGMQADIEHIQDRMERESYRFPIVALGGPTPKEDRIRKLVPWFERGRIYLPRRLLYTDSEGRCRDLIQEFLSDEYAAFPVPVHDDMLDALARFIEPDLGAEFPSGDYVELPTSTDNGRSRS